MLDQVFPPPGHLLIMRRVLLTGSRVETMSLAISPHPLKTDLRIVQFTLQQAVALTRLITGAQTKGTC